MNKISHTSVLVRARLHCTTQCSGEIAKAAQNEPAWVTGSSLTTLLNAAHCLIYPHF